jgi:hypothetical protein
MKNTSNPPARQPAGEIALSAELPSGGARVIIGCFGPMPAPWKKLEHLAGRQPPRRKRRPRRQQLELPLER